jgi:hypothetical protein
LDLRPHAFDEIAWQRSHRFTTLKLEQLISSHSRDLLCQMQLGVTVVFAVRPAPVLIHPGERFLPCSGQA